MNRSNAAYYLLSVLILVVSGIILIFRIRPVSSNQEFVQDWFWAYKTFPAHKPDMIFYGDSRTYRGIDPDELRLFFPRAVIHNMGYSSGGMNKGALQYVISLINPEAEHPAIILGITPYSLSSKARRNEQLHEERSYSFAQILERKFVYPLLSVFEPVDLNTLKHGPKGRDYVQEFRKNGWVRSYRIHEDTALALQSYREQFSETSLDSASVKETLSFAKECRKKGIAIFAFRPPSTWSMEMLEDSLSGFDEASFVSAFVAAGGQWIDIPDRYGFHSYDGSHLHYESAARLSKIIGNKIKESLSGIQREKSTI